MTDCFHLRREGLHVFEHLVQLRADALHFADAAGVDLQILDGLRGRTAAVVYVPYLAHDVHDFTTLREVGTLLADGTE